MVELARDQLVNTLAELVRIPSINPDLVPGASGERAVAEYIANRLGQTPGISVEMHEAAPGRPNVVAAAGNGRGRPLLLNGHTDTVGVEGMAEPFSGRLVGDRLYGRGAADMKDALAAMIVLLETVARQGDFPGRLVCTFVADEEYASVGTQAICARIDRWRPDAALVLESTGLNVVVAHKGFVWASIETHGFAAHGSRWQTGVDAIARMGQVLTGLEALGAELVRRPARPYVGPPSVHASLIRGGQELSSYPASCVLDIERRTIPGESAEQVRAELQGLLDGIAARDPDFAATLTMGLVRQPFEVGETAGIVRAVQAATQAVVGRPAEPQGAAGWMDSALLAAAGVETAIFGPDGEGAHGHEEWADLEVLTQFAQALARVAHDYCAGGVGAS
ncbi:MAG TPA: M20/M25/M40 family metallo-hydrolase [Thermomicrobiaceae bacterium]|nr:M20/M25/M40 family metallo-hydrolase [Thermomicrobiaceae bacterium]